MEAKFSSKMSVKFQRSTSRFIPEDWALQVQGQLWTHLPYISLHDEEVLINCSGIVMMLFPKYARTE
jgi:hypothetical protein